MMMNCDMHFICLFFGKKKTAWTASATTFKGGMENGSHALD